MMQTGVSRVTKRTSAARHLFAVSGQNRGPGGTTIIASSASRSSVTNACETPCGKDGRRQTDIDGSATPASTTVKSGSTGTSKTGPTEQLPAVDREELHLTEVAAPPAGYSFDSRSTLPERVHAVPVYARLEEWI